MFREPINSLKGAQPNQKSGACLLKLQGDTITPKLQKLTIPSAGENVEQLEIECAAVRRVNWYKHFEKLRGISTQSEYTSLSGQHFLFQVHMQQK